MSSVVPGSPDAREVNVSSSRLLCGLRVVIVVGLMLSYPLAQWLPVPWSWENGPVENLQAGLLLLAFVVSLVWSRQATTREVAAFWLMVAPLWFMLFARELSWGTVFLEPLSIDDLGPRFSSTKQLWYKPIVYPLLAFSLGLFVYFKQHRRVVWLWRQRRFPLLELGLCVVAVLVSSEAEGHGVYGFGQLTGGEKQLLEEVAELWGYVALVVAQWRVRGGFLLVGKG